MEASREGAEQDAPVVKMEDIQAGKSTDSGAEGADDIYEDSGDLDLDNLAQDALLVRLPRFLYDSWSHLPNEAELKIGRVRVEEAKGTEMRLSMMLDASLLENRNVPKEYGLSVTNPATSNTFIFSEKDMQGYKPLTSEQAPMHWTNRKKIRKAKAPVPTRKTIPKQTRLVGSIKSEICCLPVENEEYRKLIDQKALLSSRPKTVTKLLDDIVPGTGNVLNPNIAGSVSNLSSFVTPGSVARRREIASRTMRLEESELMDQIFKAFEEYAYWPFRVLNERLRQPESYLRETLGKIAFQAKSGTHMLEWQIKPEFKLSTYSDVRDFSQAKEEAAPEENSATTTKLGSVPELSDGIPESS